MLILGNNMISAAVLATTVVMLILPETSKAIHSGNRDDFISECAKFSSRNQGFVIIPYKHVQMFCEYMHREFKHSPDTDVTDDLLIYINTLYRKLIQRKVGSEYFKRQEVRTLPRQKWRKFVEKLNTLKSTMVTSGFSCYDVLNMMHRYMVSKSPGQKFLIRNRLYLLIMETALDYPIPYWDSMLDYYLEDPTKSILWTEHFLGNGEGLVQTGPFANWSSLNGKIMERHIGKTGFLINDGKVRNLLSADSHKFIVKPNIHPKYSFELLSIGPVLWLGSSKFDPLDPALLMHYAFIDYLWHRFWETLKAKDINPALDYSNLKNIKLYLFEINIIFFPRTLYAPTPSCSDCKHSKYLECIDDKCRSKSTYKEMNNVHTVINAAMNHSKRKSHRKKRNAHDLIQSNRITWRNVLEVYRRLNANNRQLSPRVIGRLIGPLRTRMAIESIGQLPIGRRFETSFTDPRTRGDPIPIGPFRRGKRTKESENNTESIIRQIIQDLKTEVLPKSVGPTTSSGSYFKHNAGTLMTLP